MPEHSGGRRTCLVVEAGAGRPRVRTRTTGDPSRPGLRPVVTGTSAVGASVCLVPDGALLLAGDVVRLDVTVGPGVRLDLVEVAGTVAYPMRGECASWTVGLDVADDATLVWAAEPFVVADGARVTRRTDVRVGARARVLVRETLVLGRHGEAPGEIRQSWRARTCDGTELLVEELHAGPGVDPPGVLGGHRVLGSLTALGVEVPDEVAPEGRLDLDAGGTVWRWLADEAHRADPDDLWRVLHDRLSDS